MQFKRFHCHSCQMRFEQAVAEAALGAFCPTCGQFVKLVRFGESLGLNFEHAVAIALIGVLIYAALKS